MRIDGDKVPESSQTGARTTAHALGVAILGAVIAGGAFAQGTSGSAGASRRSGSSLAMCYITACQEAGQQARDLIASEDLAIEALLASYQATVDRVQLAKLAVLRQWNNQSEAAVGQERDQWRGLVDRLGAEALPGGGYPICGGKRVTDALQVELFFARRRLQRTTKGAGNGAAPGLRPLLDTTERLCGPEVEAALRTMLVGPPGGEGPASAVRERAGGNGLLSMRARILRLATATWEGRKEIDRAEATEALGERLQQWGQGQPSSGVSLPIPVLGKAKQIEVSGTKELWSDVHAVVREIAETASALPDDVSTRGVVGGNEWIGRIEAGLAALSDLANQKSEQVFLLSDRQRTAFAGMLFSLAEAGSNGPLRHGAGRLEAEVREEGEVGAPKSIVCRFRWVESERGGR